MLILTRRKSETICIGENVRITVLGMRQGEVRIGIEAPLDIEIDREEIRRRKDAERAAAAMGVTQPATRIE